MDYEKAYKEVLNSAKKVLLDCTSDERNVVEYIFPELRESADEEIRKALIEYYSFDEDGHSHALDNITPEQIVNWLEKQDHDGKMWIYEDVYLKEKKQVYQDGIDEVLENPQKYGVEKQGEQKPIGHKDEDIRKEIMALIEWSKSYAASGITNNEAEKMLAWLEKIGEQKSTDNVEPKFKIGEWISIGGHTILISDIRNDLYEAIFTNGEHRVFDTNVLDKEGHLWSISDAMPGDIIYATSKFNTFDFIYIFSEIKNENSWAYCSVDSDCDDLDSGSRYWWFDNCKGSIELERYDFYPATKEQRDILFAKMKEEGYGWDNDNKELQELEQSPTDKVDNANIENVGIENADIENTDIENTNNDVSNDMPNLKVGDWVIREDGKPFRNGNRFAQIKSIKFDGNMCFLDTGRWLYSSEIRAWSIYDAQAGDVLVCPKYANDIIPNIFIFKDIDRKDNDVYCYCSFLKVFATEGYVASADPIDTDFYPATKEQCDILFQKMKESGYMWDSEKKELIINKN